MAMNVGVASATTLASTSNTTQRGSSGDDNMSKPLLRRGQHRQQDQPEQNLNHPKQPSAYSSTQKRDDYELAFPANAMHCLGSEAAAVLCGSADGCALLVAGGGGPMRSGAPNCMVVLMPDEFVKAQNNVDETNTLVNEQVKNTAFKKDAGKDDNSNNSEDLAKGSAAIKSASTSVNTFRLVNSGSSGFNNPAAPFAEKASVFFPHPDDDAPWSISSCVIPGPDEAASSVRVLLGVNNHVQPNDDASLRSPGHFSHNTSSPFSFSPLPDDVQAKENFVQASHVLLEIRRSNYSVLSGSHKPSVGANGEFSHSMSPKDTLTMSPSRISSATSEHSNDNTPIASPFSANTLIQKNTASENQTAASACSPSFATRNSSTRHSIQVLSIERIHSGYGLFPGVPDDYICASAICPNGKVFVTGSNAGTLSMWTLGDLEEASPTMRAQHHCGTRICDVFFASTVFDSTFFVVTPHYLAQFSFETGAFSKHVRLSGALRFRFAKITQPFSFIAPSNSTPAKVDHTLLPIQSEGLSRSTSPFSSQKKRPTPSLTVLLTGKKEPTSAEEGLLQNQDQVAKDSEKSNEESKSTSPSISFVAATRDSIVRALVNDSRARCFVHTYIFTESNMGLQCRASVLLSKKCAGGAMAVRKDITAVALIDYSIVILRGDSSVIRRIPPAHVAPVTGITISSCTRQVFTSGCDRIVKTWNVPPTSENGAKWLAKRFCGATVLVARKTCFSIRRAIKLVLLFGALLAIISAALATIPCATMMLKLGGFDVPHVCNMNNGVWVYVPGSGYHRLAPYFKQGNKFSWRSFQSEKNSFGIAQDEKKNYIGSSLWE